MREFHNSSSEESVPAFRRAPAKGNAVAPGATRPREVTLVMACSVAESERWIRGLPAVFAVCAVAERRALEYAMANLRPEVLIVDLALPGLCRTRGVREVLRLSPATKIVVLTKTPTEREGIATLKSGARAYCARSIAPDNLKKAVTAVQHGEIWAPRKLVPGLVAELIAMIEGREKGRLQPKAEGCFKNLTERQRVVAELITQGASNKEIGSRLQITERTVKAHLTEAFRNVGVSGRLELALLLQGHSRAPGD